MNKKYDRAKEAAAKFITIPEEEMAAEQVKRKPGRPKKNPEEGDKKPLEATEAKKSPTKTKKQGIKVNPATKPLSLPDAPNPTEPKTFVLTHEEPKPKEPTTFVLKKKEPQEQAEKPQKKSEHKSPFSVWMDKQTAADVKLYSAISGEKLTDVTEAALTEYMKNHPLTAEQKEAYKQRERERINNI